LSFLLHALRTGNWARLVLWTWVGLDFGAIAPRLRMRWFWSLGWPHKIILLSWLELPWRVSTDHVVLRTVRVLGNLTIGLGCRSLFGIKSRRSYIDSLVLALRHFVLNRERRGFVGIAVVDYGLGKRFFLVRRGVGLGSRYLFGLSFWWETLGSGSQNWTHLPALLWLMVDVVVLLLQWVNFVQQICLLRVINCDLAILHRLERAS